MSSLKGKEKRVNQKVVMETKMTEKIHCMVQIQVKISKYICVHDAQCKQL